MPTGRTVEPVLAELALGLGKALPFLALGALSVHLAGFHILLEQQPAAWTSLHPLFTDLRAAPRRRAEKYRLAGLAPVFAFLFFLAYRTFFHKTSLLPFPDNTNAGTPYRDIPGKRFSARRRPREQMILRRAEPAWN